ncbi:MAG: hypothetical protein V7676_03780 [Parasphingorhabdus sp.]|uniref:hypothetical protein n=1 Tax=Parasphingorhabdus sp. TaxID=2709688 RepID=UPI003002EAED
MADGGILSITIPPVDGNSLFAYQHAALDVMPPQLGLKREGKIAIHSAKLALCS